MDDALIYQTELMNDDTKLLELAQAFADPLRLSILQHLMGAPATVSELKSVTGAAQSRVSNHLTVLRERKLVRATRRGRQMVYELRDHSVGELVESMTALAGAAPTKLKVSAPLIKARTCYDHLAGRLGVSLYDALIDREALSEIKAPRDPIDLGTKGVEVFERLGVDLEAALRERRRFAIGCPDWTERRPHVGGALGAALWTRFFESGWLVNQPGTRIVIVTEAGKRALRKKLGIELEKASP